METLTGGNVAKAKGKGKSGGNKKSKASSGRKGVKSIQRRGSPSVVVLNAPKAGKRKGFGGAVRRIGASIDTKQVLKLGGLAGAGMFGADFAMRQGAAMFANATGKPLNPYLRIGGKAAIGVGAFMILKKPLGTLPAAAVGIGAVGSSVIDLVAVLQGRTLAGDFEGEDFDGEDFDGEDFDGEDFDE